MPFQTGALAQDPASSTLAIPLSELQRPRAVETFSSSSQSSTHESGPSTPASSIHSSTASTPSTFAQAPIAGPPATTPHISDPTTRPSYEVSSSSTPTSSSYVPSLNKAAPDALDKATKGLMPTPSHLDPPSITLESGTSSDDSTTPHDSCGGNGAAPSGILSSTLEVIAHSRATDTRFTWRSMMKNWISQRSWLQNTMGSTMLTATLIGLFIYQRRSYRIAIWAAENDFMQACIDRVQINATISERCKEVIKDGVGEAPYTKRGVYSVGVGTYKLTKRFSILIGNGVGLKWNPSRLEGLASNSTSTVRAYYTPDVAARWKPEVAARYTPDGAASYTPDGTARAYYTPAGTAVSLPTSIDDWNAQFNAQWTWTPMHCLFLFTITLALAIQGFLLFWLVSRSRTEPVITSQAHTEVKVTTLTSEGPETTSSDGPLRFTKDYPGDNHPLGKIRRRLVLDGAQEERRDSTDSDGYLRYLDSKNSSADTPVGSRNGSGFSKVSITTGYDDKHHEGLFELKSTDSTRHFLDPNTSEFIHLTPWKCPSNSHDNDSTYKLKLKYGDVSHALAKLGAGSAAFSSKQVDKTLAKENKKRSKGIKGVKEEGERKLAREIKGIKEKIDGKKKTVLRAGDCITDDMTHAAPTAKPTLVL